MKTKIILIIALGIFFVLSLSGLSESYAGEESASAAIIIIIPPMDQKPEAEEKPVENDTEEKESPSILSQEAAS